MEELLGGLIAVLLFVGIQFAVYTIYRKTQKRGLALLPNLGILVLGVATGLILVAVARQTPGSFGDLVGIILIIYSVIGTGLSLLVSFLMLYLINKRKSQPTKK